MEHQHDHFTTTEPATAFVSIIGTQAGQRHVAVSYSRREALEGLTDYLNLMMDTEVLPLGASEIDIFKAIADNLYAEAEIVECPP